MHVKCSWKIKKIIKKTKTKQSAILQRCHGIQTQSNYIRYLFLYRNMSQCQVSPDGKAELMTFWLSWAVTRVCKSVGNTLCLWCQRWEKKGKREQGKFLPFLAMSHHALEGSCYRIAKTGRIHYLKHCQSHKRKEVRGKENRKREWERAVKPDPPEREHWSQ